MEIPNAKRASTAAAGENKKKKSMEIPNARRRASTTTTGGDGNLKWKLQVTFQRNITIAFAILGLWMTIHFISLCLILMDNKQAQVVLLLFFIDILVVGSVITISWVNHRFALLFECDRLDLAYRELQHTFVMYCIGNQSLVVKYLLKAHPLQPLQREPHTHLEHDDKESRMLALV